MKTECINWNC